MYLRGNENRFIGNTIFGRSFGSPIISGEKNLIKGNVIHGSQIGLWVEGNNNRLIDNITIGNGNGIAIYNRSHDNLIHGNVALENMIDLVDENVDCDNNIWKNNVFNTTSNSILRPRPPVPVDCIH